MSRYIARPAALLILLSCTSAHASGPTQSGSEFGVSLGSYRYEEPGLMSLQGLKGGFDLRITRTHFDRHTFLRGELRYAGGTVDYTSNGTGSSSGEPDWYFEGRALIGNDWLLKSATLSSYAGLGYRFLFNDGRGITSTGPAGIDARATTSTFRQVSSIAQRYGTETKYPAWSSTTICCQAISSPNFPIPASATATSTANRRTATA